MTTCLTHIVWLPVNQCWVMLFGRDLSTAKVLRMFPGMTRQEVADDLRGSNMLLKDDNSVVLA